jgi:pseudouridine kinase
MDIKAKTLEPHVDATSNPALIITKPGGVARNIAHNLARLGVETSLLSVVGNDANAEYIIAATAKAGVNINHIIRVNAPTGIYLALLNNSGELVSAASDMRCLQFLSTEHIENLSEKIKNNFKNILDCNLSIEILEKISAITQGHMVIEPVSVTKCIKILALLKTRPIYLATPNLDQIEALTGTRDPQTAAKNLHDLGLRNIVIHAGASGAFASDGKVFTHIPSQAKSIVDVTGAGDAATAGLVLGLSQDMPLAKAAELGQKYAAQVIASELSTLE